MNRYNADQTAIIDSTGKEWPVDTWHPLPLPEGITSCPDQGHSILYRSQKYRPTQYVYDGSTHWLARKPLPELPKPKTQEELDCDAFDQWWSGPEGYSEACRNNRHLHCEIWHAALAYARKEAR